MGLDAYFCVKSKFDILLQHNVFLEILTERNYAVASHRVETKSHYLLLILLIFLGMMLFLLILIYSFDFSLSRKSSRRSINPAKTFSNSRPVISNDGEIRFVISRR